MNSKKIIIVTLGASLFVGAAFFVSSAWQNKVKYSVSLTNHVDRPLTKSEMMSLIGKQEPCDYCLTHITVSTCDDGDSGCDVGCQSTSIPGENPPELTGCVMRTEASSLTKKKCLRGPTNPGTCTFEKEIICWEYYNCVELDSQIGKVCAGGPPKNCSGSCDAGWSCACKVCMLGSKFSTTYHYSYECVY